MIAVLTAFLNGGKIFNFKSDSENQHVSSAENETNKKTRTII